MSSTRFHSLSIAATRQLPDGIALTLAIPPEKRATFSYMPGQYLTLSANIDGERVRRSYSICSYHRDDSIEVGIKRIDEGVFSNHALTLQVGDKLQVMPPEGRFTTTINASQQHHYLLVAAGSGITPCLSIAKSVLRDEPLSQITLVFGNRTIASMMFKSDIAALKDAFTERFNLINMLSAERQDTDRFNGRITGDVVRDFANSGLLHIDVYDAAYLCGPIDMVNDVAAALKALKMAEADIHLELFTTGAIAAKSVKKTPPGTPAQGQLVSLTLDGSQAQICVNPETDTILSAAQSAGIDMPFSCAGGMCCTCRCKIIEGTASMDANFSLAEWEIKAGYTLACQARPTSDNLVLDFDAS